MLCRSFSLAFAVCLLGSISSAETQPKINEFFGFEYILLPVAIKWSCGGETEQDLAWLQAIIAEHPEDAEEAELQQVIDMLLEISKRKTGLSDLVEAEIGPGLSESQLAELCAAALPLELAQSTSESEAKNFEANLKAVFAVVEGFQPADVPGLAP